MWQYGVINDYKIRKNIHIDHEKNIHESWVKVLEKRGIVILFIYLLLKIYILHIKCSRIFTLVKIK